MPSAWEPISEARRHPPPLGHIDPDVGKGWVRRMLPVVRPRRLLVLGSVVAAVAGMLVGVALPAITSRAIDEALVARTADLAPFVAMLAVGGLARALLVGLSRLGLFRTAFLIESDLRGIIFRHLGTMSFAFYDRVQTGQLISRANADIRSVQMFLAFAPLMATSVLSFVVALGFMLTIHVPLTLVAVATLPGVYVIGRSLRDHVFPLSWITQARMADVATIVDENVNGVRVVKSFAAEGRQVEALALAARRLRWAQVTTARVRARYAPAMENLPRLGLGAVLAYGGWLVIDGQVRLGALVAFNAYIVMMQTPFRLLGFFLMLGQRAAASADRIFEIVDEPPDIVDRPGAVDLVDPAGDVRFAGVRFGYADGPDVLVDLDLHLAPGETVALVGRTGCGKSTAARLVARFYDVRDGRIEIDGHDVRDLTLASLRAQVGVVLDEPFLFSATVRDNIAFGRPGAGDDEIRAAADAAQATEFVDALPEGFETLLGERGYTLSGGQRQRIALARTLLVDPPVLVLDDATSAIDVAVEARIHDALRAVTATRTTLVIAHRLSTIALADRVVLLEGGRAVASGTHAHLMATEPRYAAVLARFEPGASDPDPLGHGDLEVVG